MKKTLTELVGMCDRYIQHINKDDVTKTIVEDYTKVMIPIWSELGYDTISKNLWIGVVNETLKVIERNSIKVKELSTDWNSLAVGRCFEITKKIKRQERMSDETMASTDLIPFGVSVKKFYELVIDVSKVSPSTELYLWLCFKETEVGAFQLKEASSVLRKASRFESDDEIKALYEGQYASGNTTSSTSQNSNSVVLKRTFSSLQEVLDDFEDSNYEDENKCAVACAEHNKQLWNLKELGAITDKDFKEGVKELVRIRTEKFPLPKQKAKMEEILLSSSDEEGTVEETTTSSNEQTLTAMTNSVFHVYSEDDF